MQAELNKVIKLTYDLLSFAATSAVYKGELPSAATGRVLIELEKILPEANVAALNDAVQAEAKLKAAKGISPDDVVKEAMALSKTAAEFGEKFVEAHQTIFSAVKNSLQMQDELGMKEKSQQDILDHFKIENTSSPLFNSASEKTNSQKLDL